MDDFNLQHAKAYYRILEEAIAELVSLLGE